jgi:hypothetical protein
VEDSIVEMKETNNKVETTNREGGQMKEKGGTDYFSKAARRGLHFSICQKMAI